MTSTRSFSVQHEPRWYFVEFSGDPYRWALLKAQAEGWSTLPPNLAH